jgi:hypothetical protein
MGTALTYARRYALFPMVGIAGEDDLDAPDLCASASVSASASVPMNSEGDGASQVGNGQQWAPSRVAVNRRRGAYAGARFERPAILDAAQSATVRDKLLVEVAKITSPELAVQWAKNALVAKNSLTLTDAKLVEATFERHILGLPSSTETASPDPALPKTATTEPARQLGAKGNATIEPESNAVKSVDKSVLEIAAPRRYRNREHLRTIIKQPCLVCGRKPSDPHHIRFAQPKALGRKASDEFTVPLCRMHHREVHRVGNEQAWWKTAGIDPLKVARKLWKETRTNEGRIAPTQSVKASPDSDGRVGA